MPVPAEADALAMETTVIIAVFRLQVQQCRIRVLVNFRRYRYRVTGIADHRGIAKFTKFYSRINVELILCESTLEICICNGLWKVKRKKSIIKSCYRYNANRHEKQDHQADTGDLTVLPQLQNGSVRSAEAANCFESPSYRSREYRNYGRDGNNRKFRGQASRRESNHYYHSRDFKDRNSKDYPRDADDIGEGSKDSDNPRRQ